MSKKSVIYLFWFLESEREKAACFNKSISQIHVHTYLYVNNLIAYSQDIREIVYFAADACSNYYKKPTFWEHVDLTLHFPVLPRAQLLSQINESTLFPSSIKALPEPNRVEHHQSPTWLFSALVYYVTEWIIKSQGPAIWKTGW